MRMYCLLSQIINAAIYATVPGHNRWPISTQLLFMRLSQPSAVPQAPDRRDGEITLSLGGPESYHLWGIRRVGALWIGSYCHFYCGVTRGKSVSTEAGEVKLFCDCSFMLLESMMCYWERPPEGGRKRLASNHKPSPLVFTLHHHLSFFYLVLISASMCLVHASNHTQISYCGVYTLTKTLVLSALLRCLELFQTSFSSCSFKSVQVMW